MDDELTQSDDKAALLRDIADPGTELSAVELAVRILGAAGEPAQFWSDIANSGQYAEAHRRLAVFALFDRHVSAGMSLADMATMLAGATWLADEDVSVVSVLAGKIPVRWTLEDTVFVLHVFPELAEPDGGPWAIYLRVAGKVSSQAFADLVSGRAMPAAALRAAILEIALAPPLR